MQRQFYWFLSTLLLMLFSFLFFKNVSYLTWPNVTFFHLDLISTEDSKNSTQEIQTLHATYDNVTAGLTFAESTPRILYLTATFNGRLGNQMFIYSSLVGLARAQGRVPFIKDGVDIVKLFQISNVNNALDTSGWPVIQENAYATFNEKFMRLSKVNWVISGYLQCWRYFINAQDYIRKEFSLKPHIQSYVDSVFSKYRSEFINIVLVGVHIRRGDFVLQSNKKLGYTLPNGTFFTKAFNKMRTYFPNQNLTFLVASEDYDWCKRNINDSSVRFLPPGNATTHFALLSSCDHVIFSSGTYGWWAAWLANGVTVYFKNYIANNSYLRGGFIENDYYPPGWIGLDD